MKKYTILFLIVFSAASSVAAQPKTCDLTLREAPSLVGLRLEMSPAQVKTVFGKSLKLNVKREGTFFQNFVDKPPPAFLPNVSALYLRFFDRKLFQIEVFYKLGTERETAAPSEKETGDFVNRLSADLNLPPEAWASDDKRFYKLTCAGFSLAADRVLNPHVELTDEAARDAFQLKIKN